MLRLAIGSLLALSGCDKSNSIGEVAESGAEGTGSGGMASATETGVAESDATASTSSTTTTTTTDSASSSGEDGTETGVPLCAPDESYYEPGCAEDPGPLALPADGCYPDCAPTPHECPGTTVCIGLVIHPCPDDTCDSCGASTWVCAPADADPVCQTLIGATFESVEEYPCGPKGPELCRWDVQFGLDDTYQWNSGDFGEMASYACANGSVQTDGSADGTFDPETGILLWDGIEYALLEG